MRRRLVSPLSGTNNDFDTKENATVRYGTVEVENWLYVRLRASVHVMLTNYGFYSAFIYLITLELVYKFI